MTYIDPVVMHAYTTFLPVAKAEVGKWPIIGYGAKITGVIYVNRSDKKSRSDTRKALADMVKKGFSVCVYPEGTTHKEPQTIEFRPGTFKIAADTKTPVLPIALEYQNESVSWAGDESFLTHLFQVCKNKTIQVKMAFGTPITGGDPTEIIKNTQSFIDEKLFSFRKSWRLSLPKERVV